MLSLLTKRRVVPLVGYLTHSSCRESGSIFEAAAGHFSKIRWQRAKGLLLKPDQNLHPEQILANWNKVVDFQAPAYPDTAVDLMGMLKASSDAPSNGQSASDLGIRGKVALVTGAGAGLGRAYAMLLGKLGAKVMVNDVQNAHSVAYEIRAQGGEAASCEISVERGDAVVQTVLNSFGRVDIVSLCRATPGD